MKPRLTLLTLVSLTLFATTLCAQNPTLTTLTTSFIAPIRSATTLGAWRLAHPTDTILRSWEGNGYVQCASAHSHQAIAGGEIAEVRVMFYVPALPTSRELPVNDTPDQALDRCQAGMVRITIYDTAAAPITRLHQRLQQDLAAAHLFGDATLPWMQSEAGSVDGLSRHDDGVIVASARFMDARQGEIAFQCCALTVHVAARRAHEDPNLPGWQQAVPPAIDAASIQSKRQRATNPVLALFRVARVDGALEHEMHSTMAQAADSDVSSSTMIDLLHRWLAALKPLPSIRRAAALMVADSLMMSWNSEFAADSAGDTLHDRFVSIGVPLSLEHSDEDGWLYIYQRDWAMEAYRIAPTSRAGEYAFLHIIATEGQCATDQSAIIARSESYLRQYPHAAIRGQLHAFLGQEWAGEYTAVSADGNVEFSPPNSVRPRAALARQRAIAHFQAAFRLNVDPETTWNNAFLVLAGLPVTGGDGDCE